MLALSPSQRILLAVHAVDFRKGIDGLIGLCRQQLGENPLLGTLFVFTNRRRTALKLLTYDGQGFYLILKRFSQGRLRWWPDGTQPCHELAARELAILLWNGHPRQAAWAPLWRPLSATPTVGPGNSTAAKARGLDAAQIGAAAGLAGKQTDSFRPGLPF
ncbi:MAG: IS66 family insertion sequence element accessory protein TnpB [Syntrophobacterales bacterium]|nr:MAG: IS66 family insertion sequence element accessory protein TnpB [Syntrophobacterales bacterium]